MPEAPLSVRASPPTARVMAILEFLATHPQRRFGLSELARQVSMSKPTCLGIITTLLDLGYLVRDDTAKEYGLGPALIALGSAAQDSLRAGPAARAELSRLCEACTGAAAALAAVVDDRITLLEVVTPALSRATVQAGQSYPFAPPVGLMYVLWDEQALRTWLSRPPTIPVHTDDARLARVVTECRRLGYLAERLTPGGRRLYSLMAGLPGDLPDELQALLGELVSTIGERVYLPTHGASRKKHDISVISAPVYDHHQRQAMLVSLQVNRSLTDNEIATLARRVMQCAAALTAQCGGSQPPTAGAQPGDRV